MSTIQADTDLIDIARLLSPSEVAVVQALLAAQAPSFAAFLGMGEGLLAVSFAEMLHQIGVNKRNIVVAGTTVPSDSQASRVLAELSTPIVNDLSALLRDWAEVEARFDVVIIDAAVCPQVSETWFWRRLLPVCGANALVVVHSLHDPVLGVRHTRLPGGRLSIVTIAEDGAGLAGSFELPQDEMGVISVERWLQQAQLVDREIPKDTLMIQGNSLLIHPVKGRPNVVWLPLPLMPEGPVRVSAAVELRHINAPPIEFAIMVKSLETGDSVSTVTPRDWLMVSRTCRRYPLSLQFETHADRRNVLLMATRLALNTENYYAHAWWSDIQIDHGWAL